ILHEAIAVLRTCVHVFADPKSVNLSELRQLADAARSVIDEESALNEWEEARSIFGDAFQGSRTSTETLSAIVRWAAAAEPQAQLLSTILTANATVEARSRIAEVLQAERTAQEILARASEAGKIDSRHFTDGGSWREIAQRLDRAAQDPEGLFNHAVFATVL